MQSDLQHEREKEGLDEQFAFFGIEHDAGEVIPDSEPFFLWPDHFEAWRLFMDLQTQWRIGMAGPSGLDYAAVLAHLHLAVKPKSLRLRYEELRVLERGFLDGFAERPRGKS